MLDWESNENEFEDTWSSVWAENREYNQEEPFIRQPFFKNINHESHQQHFPSDISFNENTVSRINKLEDSMQQFIDQLANSRAKINKEPNDLCTQLDSGLNGKELEFELSTTREKKDQVQEEDLVDSNSNDLSDSEFGFKKFWFDYGSEPSSLREVFDDIDEAKRIMEVMKEIERFSEEEIMERFYSERPTEELFQVTSGILGKKPPETQTPTIIPNVESKKSENDLPNSVMDSEDVEIKNAIIGFVKLRKNGEEMRSSKLEEEDINPTIAPPPPYVPPLPLQETFKCTKIIDVEIP